VRATSLSTVFGTGSSRKASSLCPVPGKNAFHRRLTCRRKGEAPKPRIWPLPHGPLKCVSTRLAMDGNALQGRSSKHGFLMGGRRVVRGRAAARHATAILYPHAPGRAFALLPAGCGPIAGSP
jgi:hypothetical protein